MSSELSLPRTRLFVLAIVGVLCASLAHAPQVDARLLAHVSFPSLDRNAIVGWSHGGSTALATINARDREVAAFRDKAGAPPFFRAAVAFYPGCGVSLRAGERWQPAVPTRIHIGALDDWTPAKSCV